MVASTDWVVVADTEWAVVVDTESRVGVGADTLLVAVMIDPGAAEGGDTAWLVAELAMPECGLFPARWGILGIWASRLR